MLNGQKLQGPATSAEVYLILKQRSLVDKSVYNRLFLHLSVNRPLCFYFLLFLVCRGAVCTILEH